jgi:TPR repeat protein
VEANLAEAAKWLKLAQPAFPDDPDVKRALADVERMQNSQAANAAYKKSIELHRLAAQGQGSMEEAMAMLGQAADLGQPEAMATLALCYMKGKDVPPDEARAEALIAKVEKSSNPLVQYIIAKAYLPEYTAPAVRSIDRAVVFLRRAAIQGFPPAQNGYGYYLMSTTDGNQDLVEAFKWLTLSAAKGDNAARVNLDHLRPTLSPAQIEEGNRRANDFRPVLEKPWPFTPASGQPSQVESIK